MITVTVLSRMVVAAQSVRSARSRSITRAASAPLSSPPCTLPAIQTMAGLLAAIWAAFAGVVWGSRSCLAALLAAATSAGEPTTAYVSGRPSFEVPKDPSRTSSLASSTATR